MAAERCADSEFFLPAEALMTVPVGTGYGWAYGAWTEVTAAAGADWVWTSLVVKYSANVGRTNEIQVGIGASGAEVAIGTVRVHGYALYWTWGQYALPVPIDAIPAGSRVSVRARSFLAYSTTALTVSLGFLAKPLSSGTSLTTTAQAIQSLPTTKELLSVPASGVEWAWGSWAEIAAVTAAAWVLGSVTNEPSTGVKTRAEVEIGIGAAGAESAVMWFPVSVVTSRSFGNYSWRCPVPLDAIPAGVRVSIRFRSNSTDASPLPMAVCYYEKPL